MCIDHIKKVREEKRILSILKSFGKKSSQVERLTFDRKPSKNQTYWYYTGPLDEKTRPFCRQILEMDKVFSESEIEKISGYLGYDVLRPTGSFGPGAFNCRHNWARFRGKEILTPKVTVKQINDLIRKGIRV